MAAFAASPLKRTASPPRLREGDSLLVSSVCLTALDPDPTYFYADLAQETLDRTSLGSLAPGARVNLELPTAAGSPLGGHIVQGHVDGTGTLTALEPVVPESSPHIDRQTTDWALKVRVPEKHQSMDGPQRLRGHRGHQPDHRSC